MRKVQIRQMPRPAQPTEWTSIARSRNFLRGDGAQLESDGVCYTMRTYIVAREDKDSDVTRPVRVTRCLPATKLEFKSAVAPVRSEDDSREQR